MRLPITIDGVDFTPYTSKNAYTVEYVKREGPNSGQMMDGSQVIDLLAYKALITWELNALTSAQLSAVLQAAQKQYVTVSYFDTAINDVRQATFIPTVGAQAYAFARHGLHYFRDGTVLTLLEK